MPLEFKCVPYPIELHGYKDAPAGYGRRLSADAAKHWGQITAGPTRDSARLLSGSPGACLQPSPLMRLMRRRRRIRFVPISRGPGPGSRSARTGSRGRGLRRRTPVFLAGTARVRGVLLAARGAARVKVALGHRLLGRDPDPVVDVLHPAHRIGDV